MDYVGFTNRHLHPRISEHTAQLVDRKAHHVKEHGVEKPTLTDNFSVLYEMLFIQKLKPSLNMQSDSIRAKLFY